jgi:hypothetical protein
MSGLGVATAAIGDGVAVVVGSGSAVAGFVYDSNPPASSATPMAVSKAGTIRVRIRSKKAAIGAAS